MDKFSFEKNLDKDFVLHATASIAYPEDRAWSHLSKQYMYTYVAYFYIWCTVHVSRLLYGTLQKHPEKSCVCTRPFLIFLKHQKTHSFQNKIS